MMPSQTGSTPGIASSGGATIGTTTKMISNASITKPSRNIASITARIAPAAPPGRSTSARCTMSSPPSPRNTRLNSVAPIRMVKIIDVICVVLVTVGVRYPARQTWRTAKSRAPATAIISRHEQPSRHRRAQHDQCEEARDAKTRRPARRAFDAQRGQQDRADRADGSGFGRRRKPDQDRAEHHDDQQHRRDHRPGDLRDEREAMRRRRIGRDRRHGGGPQNRDRDEKQEIEQHQRQPRHERAGEQVADRNRLRREDALGELRGLKRIVELVAEQHQHGRGRQDLRERRGRRHRAGGEALVVAVAQHRRQRDQRDGDDGGADHALGGGEQHADQHDRDAEAAGQRAEQPAHRFEQILGDARALQHHAHEDEQRDREQHRVGHHAEDALRQRVEEAEVHRAERRGRAAAKASDTPPSVSATG